MTTVTDQTKHQHGLGNLRVPREKIHQCLKAELRNINLIDVQTTWFFKYISVIFQQYQQCFCPYNLLKERKHVYVSIIYLCIYVPECALRGFEALAIIR